MSLGNVVPGFIARDPEKAAALMEEMGHAPVPFVRTEGGPSSVLQSVIPGMEDWVPEDDTPEVQYMDEIGKSTIYRIVNEHGKVERSSTSTAFNKPYYSTLKGARSALTYLRRRVNGKFRLQKGEVTWEEL